MQWSTEKAGDFLITAWLEECEVGGCAKACSVQVGDHVEPLHVSIKLPAFAMSGRGSCSSNVSYDKTCGLPDV